MVSKEGISGWCHRDWRQATSLSEGTAIGRTSKKRAVRVVGGSTVCGYVNAIVDIYNKQVSLKINSNEHPRTSAVKQLIKNVQAQNIKTRDYLNRGVGSLLDGN